MIQNTKSNFNILIILISAILISSGFISGIAGGEAVSTENGNNTGLSASRNKIDSSNSRDLGIADYSPRVDIDDSNVMYAIIAPDIFADELMPLADWKTYKGVPTKIYNLNGTNGILTKYSGRDDAERLHKFLRALDDSSPPLTWLLLAGDAGIIPIRDLYIDANAGNHNVDESYISDYYYAGLDHNWDFDNDGKYGEGHADALPIEADWSPNVYVGRIPVEDEADTNIVVNKILTYEKSPPSGNWLKSAVLWGGLMDAPNDMSTSDGDPKYEPEEDNAYEVKELKVLPLIPSHMTVTKRYDYAQLPGGNYNKGNDNLYRANAMVDFNKGNSIVNFAGQAYYCGAAILDYTDPDGTAHIGESSAYDELYWWDDARDSTNGDKLPLVFLCTCGAGDFAEGEKPGDDLTWKDKTMEHLITSSTGGAIGLIGSTGATYRGEDTLGKSDGNWWLDAKFWELFFNGEYQQGKTFFKMKTEYIKSLILMYASHKAELYGYNLQGDPEVSIWTDTPRSLTVFPSGIWVGSHNVTVKVLGLANTPIENARVCLQNSEVYAYGVTNSTGEATISVDAASTGPIDIVVTAHNYLFYEDTLDIEIEPADLTLSTNDIQFSNNNPEEDEQVTISATIHNQGQTAFTPPVTIRFTDGNPNKGGLKISDKVLSDAIVIGGQKAVQTLWTAIGGGNHSIYVEIDPEGVVVESFKNNNQAFKSLRVEQPDLTISPDDISITPTGTVSQTQEVTISVVVHNVGEVSVSDVIVKFYIKDPVNGDQQIGSDKTISSIAIGKTGEASILWSPTTSGDQEIIVKIDPDNNISESNESNNEAEKSFTVNSPPIISDIPDLPLDEDSISLNAIDLELYIYDADNTIYELYIELQNTNSSHCIVNLTSENTINIIPEANWNGLSVVNVNVSDGIDATEGSFTVTINPINDAPVLSPIGIIEINESEDFNFTVTAFDIDSETLTFSDNTELFDIDPTTGVISFTATSADLGEHYITIKVNDNHPQTPKVDEEVLTLKVLNVPDPPNLTPIGTLYATAGELFSYTTTATDPDSELLLFSDDTHLFDIEKRSGIINFLPQEADAGTYYRITITVSDGMLTDSENITLYINTSDSGHPDDNGNGGNGDDSSFSLTEGVPILLILIIIIVIILVIVMAMLFRKKSEQKAWDEFSKDDDRLESEYEPDNDIDTPSARAGPELAPITLSEYDQPRSIPKRKVVKKKIKKKD